MAMHSQFQTRIRATALAVLLTGGLAAGAAAEEASSAKPATQAGSQTYSAFYVFGDGFNDAGTYLVKSGDATVAHRWTVNPAEVWVQTVAAAYNLPMTANINVNTETGAVTTVGGTNYAQGGARVSQMPGIYSHTTHSMKDQVDAYLSSNGGKADADALYALSAGMNDIFYQGEQIKAKKTSMGDAKDNVHTAASDLADIVKQLAAAGAQHIIVFNVQDLAATPLGNSHGMFARMFFKKDSETFNGALETGLADIKDIKVIYVDTFTFLNKVIDDPGTYKLDNVKDAACSTPSSITCTEDTLNSGASATTWLFADQVRLGAGHAALAKYIQSLLPAAKSGD